MMLETRSTFRDWLRPAVAIGGAGLISLLCWAAASAAFTDPGRGLPIALAPLIVASFHHPWFARVLGWSGILAQVAVLFLSL
jgi:hypothetical protein